EVAAEVTGALGRLRGESLAVVDPGRVERLAASLPSVRAVSVDRDFPGTLRVSVVPERPVAVLRSGEGAWLLGAGGGVIRGLPRGDLPRLPRIWLPASVRGIAPGRRLPEGAGGAAVEALARV